VHNLTFRPAAHTDIPAIVALVNRAYRDTSVRGWTSECDIVKGDRTHAGEIESLLNKPDSVLLVVLMDKQLSGCVHLQSHGDEVYLGMLTIEPQLQNAGLGKLLLREAERFAQEQMGGESIAMIVVGQRTELIDFYLRRGYRRIGEVSPYPVDRNVGTPKVDGLFMEKLVKRLPV